jgi:hypothetical protein
MPFQGLNGIVLIYLGRRPRLYYDAPVALTIFVQSIAG